MLFSQESRLLFFLLAGSDFYSNYLYIEFGHRFLRTFLFEVDGVNRTMDDLITDAAYCIMFVGFWKRDLGRRGGEVKLKLNFLTWETSQDVLIACMMIILAAKAYRIYFPTVRFEPSRFSSRFSEYVFQALRSSTKTSNKVAALQSLHLTRAIMEMRCLEGECCDGEPVVESRRGMPRGKLGVSTEWNSAPEGYYPCDVRIEAAIRKAYDQIKANLDTALHSLMTSDTFNFWSSIGLPYGDLAKLELIQTKVGLTLFTHT